VFRHGSPAIKWPIDFQRFPALVIAVAELLLKFGQAGFGFGYVIAVASIKIWLTDLL